MTAILDKPLGHMVFSDVSWDRFETILDSIGEKHYRMAYDDGDLEFMTTSFEHDHFGRWMGTLIFFVALELHVPICSGGSTTLKKRLRKKGLEPDECFWIQHESHMRGRKQWKAKADPPPDLAVEVDITRSWLDRIGIYAALGVPEVWCFDGKKLRVLTLGAGGKYREKSKSVAFPSLPLEGFERFVRKLGTAEETRLIREFTEWLRSEVVAKKSNNGRKNDKS
jgi:Uma2 family endonuclease